MISGDEKKVPKARRVKRRRDAAPPPPPRDPNYSTAVRNFWERREIAVADRRIRAIDLLREKALQERSKKERVERITLYSLLSVTIIIVFIIWFTNGRIIDRSLGFLQSLEDRLKVTSAKKILNCELPSNRNNTICLDRKGKKSSEWSALSVSKSGGKSAFALHDSK